MQPRRSDETIGLGRGRGADLAGPGVGVHPRCRDRLLRSQRHQRAGRAQQRTGEDQVPARYLPLREGAEAQDRPEDRVRRRPGAAGPRQAPEGAGRPGRRGHPLPEPGQAARSDRLPRRWPRRQRAGRDQPLDHAAVDACSTIATSSSSTSGAPATRRRASGATTSSRTPSTTPPKPDILEQVRRPLQEGQGRLHQVRHQGRRQRRRRRAQGSRDSTR